MNDYFAGRRAFITGGSSGIGLATARRLARGGADVVICARDAGRLEAARAELAALARPGRHVSSLILDVCDQEAVAAAPAEVMSRMGGLDLLVNNAGIVHPGHFQDLSGPVFDATLSTNFLGAVRMTRAFLPALVASGRGHVTFVSSVSGFLGVFGYTAYAGSKFALTGFAECLRQELKPRGVGVSVLFPPDTDTPQLAEENRLKPAETHAIAETIKPVSADFVAGALLDGIEAGRAHIHPGTETRLLSLIQRLAPSLVRWYMDAKVRKVAEAKVRKVAELRV
jgi:3-dehydrosphinganine reductase